MATEVKGMREAKAAFAKMPEVFRDNLNDLATEPTVREIARGAQAHIRSSPSIRTRSLLNHIAWTINRKTGRGRVGVSAGSTSVATGVVGEISRRRVKGIVIAGRGGSASKRAGAKVIRPDKYAHFVEFGTRHMAAEPFMIPAAEAEKDPYLQRCRAAGRASEQDLANIGSRNL